MQTIPLTGLIIVSTPSSLSILDVSKIINMAKAMEVRVLGIVENMAYFECPGCREKVYPFGEGSGQEAGGKIWPAVPRPVASGPPERWKGRHHVR